MLRFSFPFLLLLKEPHEVISPAIECLVYAAGGAIRSKLGRKLAVPEEGEEHEEHADAGKAQMMKQQSQEEPDGFELDDCPEQLRFIWADRLQTSLVDALRRPESIDPVLRDQQACDSAVAEAAVKAVGRIRMILGRVKELLCHAIEERILAPSVEITVSHDVEKLLGIAEQLLSLGMSGMSLPFPGFVTPGWAMRAPEQILETARALHGIIFQIHTLRMSSDFAGSCRLLLALAKHIQVIGSRAGQAVADRLDLNFWRTVAEEVHAALLELSAAFCCWASTAPGAQDCIVDLVLEVVWPALELIEGEDLQGQLSITAMSAEVLRRLRPVLLEPVLIELSSRHREAQTELQNSDGLQDMLCTILDVSSEVILLSSPGASQWLLRTQCCLSKLVAALLLPSLCTVTSGGREPQEMTAHVSFIETPSNLHLAITQLLPFTVEHREDCALDTLDLQPAIFNLVLAALLEAAAEALPIWGQDSVDKHVGLRLSLGFQQTVEFCSKAPSGLSTGSHSVPWPCGLAMLATALGEMSNKGWDFVELRHEWLRVQTSLGFAICEQLQKMPDDYATWTAWSMTTLPMTVPDSAETHAPAPTKMNPSTRAAKVLNALISGPVAAPFAPLLLQLLVRRQLDTVRASAASTRAYQDHDHRDLPCIDNDPLRIFSSVASHQLIAVLLPRFASASAVSSLGHKLLCFSPSLPAEAQATACLILALASQHPSAILSVLLRHPISSLLELLSCAAGIEAHSSNSELPQVCSRLRVAACFILKLASMTSLRAPGVWPRF